MTYPIAYSRTLDSYSSEVGFILKHIYKAYGKIAYGVIWIHSLLKQANLKCYTIRSIWLKTKLQELTANKSQFTAAQKYNRPHHKVILKINVWCSQ